MLRKVTGNLYAEPQQRSPPETGGHKYTFYPIVQQFPSCRNAKIPRFLSYPFTDCIFKTYMSFKLTNSKIQVHLL